MRLTDQRLSQALIGIKRKDLIVNRMLRDLHYLESNQKTKDQNRVSKFTYRD
jgi:hypothetical protein